ncbi:multi-sensor signal transduction histidine kinase [Halosimplex carlsbadense 2-9-1]|uniref:histidine kinase n=1 Tax=Halosimplex carlsbadense 2-9-1 TaxID=797114 RepID=M0D381_9EURY|nr:PAS domain S-box protein [Halosimplex carlsbadense]ELZ29313.1 multi-sensor signal transduction histidine kinase [Halosimplex carlsbadense 2-9-1]
MNDRPRPVCVVRVGGDPDPESDALAAVAGATVRRVDGPDDALAALDDERVDCVVVDPDDAEWDPVALVAALNQRDPGLDAPVVLATTSDLDPYVEADVVGALAAVVRPDDQRALTDAVGEALAASRERAADREDAARYRALVEGAPVPVCALDGDGAIRSANDALAALLELADPDDVVDRNAREFVAADARASAAARLERVIDDRERTPPAQRTLVAADGTEKYALASMQPVTDRGEPAAQVVLHNVTEHKRLEAALREQRDRFSTLFEHLSEPVVATEFDDGGPLVTDVNESFAETFGVDAAAVTGRPLDDLIVPTEDRETAAAFNERARTGERLEVEVRRRTPDGPRDFLLRFAPYDDASGGYAIYIDVTERREWERQLRRQNERLEEVARVVSHDLRNPLNVAAGTADALAADADDEDRDHFERIGRAHDRMAAIVDDMLALARQGQSVSDLGPVALAAMARDAWDTVETADATLDIRTTATVMADESRLRGAFENLFTNAVTHGGADVTVTVGDMPDCPVDERDDGDPRRGGFFVADDGRGVPDEDRERVFDSGYSTGEESTGFGLAIVQSIVEAHGWDVRVTDRLDGESGARFEVTGVEFAGN